jgi:hypothetical protein
MSMDARYRSDNPSHNLYAFVAGYAGLVFVAVSAFQVALEWHGIWSFHVPGLTFPALIICAAVAVVGFVLILSTLPPSSPPPSPWDLRGLLLAILVVVIIGGAFAYAHANRSTALSVDAGVASALAWGLSVVGALIWSHLGIVSSIYWNSWFNLFAAAFAALAVGYT